ncbi:MAG: hypothetical protein EOP33_02475 [Rickettsiaceae bacterium]|nr:MAG: hypothetical protein EOP33_02475 [Rickettsiaceae bacterium]
MLPKERFLLKTKNLALFCSLQEHEIPISVSNSSWLRYRRIVEKTNQKIIGLIAEKLFFSSLFIVSIAVLTLSQIKVSNPTHHSGPLIQSLISLPVILNTTYFVVVFIYNLHIFFNFKSIRWRHPMELIVDIGYSLFFVVSSIYKLCIVLDFKRIKWCYSIKLVINIGSWIFSFLKLFINFISQIFAMTGSYAIFYIFLFSIMQGYQFLCTEFPSFTSSPVIEDLCKLIQKSIIANKCKSIFLITIISVAILNVATKYINFLLKNFLTIYHIKWKLAQHSLASFLVLFYAIMATICFTPSADSYSQALGIGSIVLGFIFHAENMLSVEYEIDKELHLKSMILKLIDLYYELE